MYCITHYCSLWCLKGRHDDLLNWPTFPTHQFSIDSPHPPATKSHSGLRSFQVCAQSVSFSLGEGLWCHPRMWYPIGITYSKYMKIILFETSYWSWFVFDLCLSKMISQYPVLTSTSQEPLEICKSQHQELGFISVHTHMKRVASRGLRETLESLPQQSLDELSINGHILDVA